MLLTRAPVAGGEKQASLPAAPRLACVKPVASVHPEPGSNSSLFILFLLFLKGVLCRLRPCGLPRHLVPTGPLRSLTETEANDFRPGLNLLFFGIDRKLYLAPVLLRLL